LPRLAPGDEPPQCVGGGGILIGVADQGPGQLGGPLSELDRLTRQHDAPDLVTDLGLGAPLARPRVMTCSPSRTVIFVTVPGRPFIRSETDRSRSTVTQPGGSESPSDSVSTWA